MPTKCYECGKLMKEKTITYHYAESGLPNIYLEGVTNFECGTCGVSYVDIPEPVQLHIVLAIAISNKPIRLTGPEIRFLRKEVGMSGKAFSEFIGVDPVTLSRWENDRGDANKEESNDRLIRIAFKVMMCERLKTYIQWVEFQIKKTEIIDFKRNRLDIHADAMKYITLTQSIPTECNCTE
jgi:putative zinc finger/helix-turn-helix YgiT family protein